MRFSPGFCRCYGTGLLRLRSFVGLGSLCLCLRGGSSFCLRSLGLGGLDGSGLGSLDRLSGSGRSGLLVLLEVILLEGNEQDATDHSADEDREDPQRTVLDNGQDQEATVRRRIVNVEHNGQDRGDGGTEHHDGHDGPDVLGHERNSALGDVGATKDEVDDTGVMILLAEVLLADDDGKGGDQRRNDAGGGDGAGIH